MHPKTLLFCLVISALLSPDAFAVKKTSPQLPKEPTVAKPAATVILDAWYTISTKDGAHYGYYNDRAEIRGGKLFFQNHVWKKEEDFVNEEQLGAYAEANDDLIPLFYNFHSTYRTTEITIDGTVTEGKFTARVRRGTEELPVVKKSLPPKTFFSVMFPLWVKQNFKKLPIGKSVSFRTHPEDGYEQGFQMIPGSIRVEKPDEFAQKNGLQKCTVEYHGVNSSWWLDSEGIAKRIDMPAQGIKVERASAETAKGFLE